MLLLIDLHGNRGGCEYALMMLRNKCLTLQASTLFILRMSTPKYLAALAKAVRFYAVSAPCHPSSSTDALFLPRRTGKRRWRSGYLLSCNYSRVLSPHVIFRNTSRIRFWHRGFWSSRTLLIANKTADAFATRWKMANASALMRLAVSCKIP